MSEVLRSGSLGKGYHSHPLWVFIVFGETGARVLSIGSTGDRQLEMGFLYLHLTRPIDHERWGSVPITEQGPSTPSLSRE